MSKPTGVESVRDWQFAVPIALIGLGSGVALWLLTTLLSRSTISGNGWSLAGNGALIIPFGLGPAVVAGGWTAIILRMRGHPRWLQLGFASGLIALVLVVGSVVSTGASIGFRLARASPTAGRDTERPWQLDRYTWDREAERQLANLVGDSGNRGFVLASCCIDARLDPSGDPLHLALAHPACRHSRRTDPKP